MAILRTEEGRTLSTYREINERIRPATVGAFPLPPTIQRLIESLDLPPLTPAGAARILETFDPELDRTLRAEGFVHRRVGCLMRGERSDPDNKSIVGFYTVPGPSGVMPEQKLKDYGTPHRLDADDRHQVYAGAIVKGLVLADGRHGMIYVTAGEWIRLRTTVINWPIFTYDGPNIAVSYFDSMPQTADGNYNMHFETGLAPNISE